MKSRLLAIMILATWLCPAWTGSSHAGAASPDAAAAGTLRDRFADLRAKKEGRLGVAPIYLQSREGSGTLEGDIYAVVDHSFAEIRSALSRSHQWCSILILHLNVKYCRASKTGASDALSVGVGRKFEQPLADVYWMRFTFDVAQSSDEFLSVVLLAPEGPLSTRDYRIQIYAAPLAGRHSLVHVAYTYSYGLLARSAMDAYLATLGSGKVGFSVLGRGPDGRPILVGGVRGVIERNTMRYYLAIDSYLGAHALPVQSRLRRSLEDWFSATERHAPQLHELERDAYLEMKLREVRRQESEVISPPGQ